MQVQLQPGRVGLGFFHQVSGGVGSSQPGNERGKNADPGPDTRRASCIDLHLGTADRYATCIELDGAPAFNEARGSSTSIIELFLPRPVPKRVAPCRITDARHDFALLEVAP